MSYMGNVGSQYNYTTTDWLDTGDNSWQLTAATLVGLQSVPGLVISVSTNCAIRRSYLPY